MRQQGFLFHVFPGIRERQVEVSASEALPGDIVYYGWHVGIYIGNGQMIHAPEEGDVVKISTVDWAAHTFVRCW